MLFDPHRSLYRVGGRSALRTPRTPRASDGVAVGDGGGRPEPQARTLLRTVRSATGGATARHRGAGVHQDVYEPRDRRLHSELRRASRPGRQVHLQALVLPGPERPVRAALSLSGDQFSRFYTLLTQSLYSPILLRFNCTCSIQYSFFSYNIRYQYTSFLHHVLFRIILANDN